MFFRKRNFSSIFNISEKNLYKYECIKICLIYVIIGSLWIYYSDEVANKIAVNSDMLLIISTYKGWFYVLITAVILYLLIVRLLKKIWIIEEKLRESYEELSASNEELQAYVGQLTASEEELRAQYEQIARSEERLRKSEQKNSAIIKAIPDLLFILDKEGNFVDCMMNDESQLYMPKDSFIGKNIQLVMPQDIAEISSQKIKKVLEYGILESFEYELEEEYFELRMVKNNETEVLAIARNITLEKGLQKRLEYLSYHDQLTGLYNRRFFEEELKRRDKIENLPLSVIMADVNGLKLVNDSFGHAIGDELLKKVADVIKKGCRDNDIVSRLGGDEFVVILSNTSNEEAEKIVEQIQALALKEKVGSVNISISFGHEAKTSTEEIFETVFKKAEDYMYKRKVFESQGMRGKTISAIISTINEKNKREEQHSNRVSKLCEDMGKALKLSEDNIKELKTAGLLHDIGKIAIDENILNKPGKLTHEEWDEIKKHPEVGYRILSTVNEMLEISRYILAHHEKIDGTGYPKNLKGDEIPLQAKIIAIADAYDAMTSERSYRDAFPEETVIKELKEKSGSQFDESLVTIFIEKVLNKKM